MEIEKELSYLIRKIFRDKRKRGLLLNIESKMAVLKNDEFVLYRIITIRHIDYFFITHNISGLILFYCVVQENELTDYPDGYFPLILNNKNKERIKDFLQTYILTQS